MFFYLLKLSNKELKIFEKALKDAIERLKEIYHFDKNKKNRYLYYNAYYFYINYKKIQKEIENNKDKNIVYKSEGGEKKYE